MGMMQFIDHIKDKNPDVKCIFSSSETNVKMSPSHMLINPI